MKIDESIDNRIPQRAPQKREAPEPAKAPRVLPRRDLDFDLGTGFQGGPSRRRGYQLALWSWLASFIDALVLISLSCVFMLVFSLIVKTSVGAMVKDVLYSQSQLMTFAEIFVLFAWVYMISIRSLMGSTIGEWACDLRLGQPHERLQVGYIFRVALRCTLILITGIVTLPILSLVAGKDLAGGLSGLSLFSLK